MKELLNNENLKKFEQIQKVRALFDQFARSYHQGRSSFISDRDPRAYFYFDGVTRLEIEGEEMFLVGFGLRKHPQAKPAKNRLGDDNGGKVKVFEISEIVNLLAQYEDIYPQVNRSGY